MSVLGLMVCVLLVKSRLVDVLLRVVSVAVCVVVVVLLLPRSARLRVSPLRPLRESSRRRWDQVFGKFAMQQFIRFVTYLILMNYTFL